MEYVCITVLVLLCVHCLYLIWEARKRWPKYRTVTLEGANEFAREQLQVHDIQMVRMGPYVLKTCAVVEGSDALQISEEMFKVLPVMVQGAIRSSAVLCISDAKLKLEPDSEPKSEPESEPEPSFEDDIATVPYDDSASG